MTRRILHVSDLHFGRDRPELLRPLIDTINRIAPDLVAVSGDFTQRARLGQFRAARTFLAHLEPPWLAVPGNHDTPLDNLAVRLVRPWARYRRYIHDDLSPSWADDEIAVAGANTANPFSWQRGRLSGGAVARMCRAFRANEDDRTHIAVLHHPLEHGPDVEKRLMRGARDALRRMGDCGVDVVLSGHLHNWQVRPFSDAGGVLFVQAGTSLSTRHRGEPNDFNLLTFDGPRVRIAQWAASHAEPRFAPHREIAFEKRGGTWQPLASAAPDAADRTD